MSTLQFSGDERLKANTDMDGGMIAPHQKVCRIYVEIEAEMSKCTKQLQMSPKETAATLEEMLPEEQEAAPSNLAALAELGSTQLAAGKSHAAMITLQKFLSLTEGYQQTACQQLGLADIHEKLSLAVVAVGDFKLSLQQRNHQISIMESLPIGPLDEGNPFMGQNTKDREMAMAYYNV